MKTVFQYVVAVDYENTLVSVKAKDATAAHATIKAVRVEQPSHFD